MEERFVIIEITCPDCGGDGHHEIGPECDRPASACCGGCYRYEICETCCDEKVVEGKLTEDNVQELIDHLRRAFPDLNHIRETLHDFINQNK